MTFLRVAVVGSGPAGMYAIQHLLEQSLFDVDIDLFERLPTPWGLVRAGVAPDHPEKKLIADRLFRFFLKRDNVRFFGNVEIGSDISHDELTASVEARFREVFGAAASAFLVFNGTGANVLALRALLRPWEGVVCAESAHLNVDEGGAPEALALGPAPRRARRRHGAARPGGPAARGAVHRLLRGRADPRPHRSWQ